MNTALSCRSVHKRVFACVAACVISLHAADEKTAKKDPTEEEVKAAMEATSPGPAHKVLEAFVGEWTLHNKMWMQPGADPMESEGTASAKWIMGNRYVETTIKSTMMGQAFEGRAICGYDNLKKTYLGFWIDNMGTSMTLTSGTLSADGKTLTSKGKMDDAWTGKKDQEYKFVDRFISKDEVNSAIYLVEAGKETKIMEMTYKRKK
ncbi:MAG TPA: DUF1579 domain-containing protein [Verrucomicrobiales bacterium]|nr:DUF1579 domain-containing protein [Verrucomicrobiales bacterium]